jgi:hypothetical protein
LGGVTTKEQNVMIRNYLDSITKSHIWDHRTYKKLVQKHEYLDSIMIHTPVLGVDETP